ncbi:Zinc finger SWIM domain-containing protein 8 [Amphibalanus amphitrite]|uniref:Zinc finger SWIM domain-containing protein 8 n=1 Tax=Amphibalanus amphitrite TaxID=1232801 RepID=A0A6A4WWC8_AMPAM|nr:Zinc finger SWIM domain-containing protein 8 [Amphibalanus amphitrite]
MWNLLSIVREMMRRHDRNAVPLLEIITEECLQCDQIVIWWVNTKLALHSGGAGHAAKNHTASNSQASQHACASLCEEIVVQWRLAALSATLSQTDRDQLREQFLAWHLKVMDKYKSKSQSGGTTGRRQNDIDIFPGFKPAIEACHLSWDNYQMTAQGAAVRPERIRHAEPGLSQQSGPVHSSTVVLQMLDGGGGDRLEAGNRSSVSSEGFCETEDQEGSPSAPAEGQQREGEAAPTDEERVLNSIRPVTDHWEVLFARAEGLHAHGFTPDACRIGVTLAQQLLSNPPDLTVEPAVAQAKTKKRRGVNPVTHQVTCLASTTLSRCHFLCTVLAEEQEHHHLAFQVGLYGLEMCRPPASTKPLEVKLANQEAELLQLLRRIPLWPSELAVLRQRAECLRSGELKTRGEALVPLTLATLIVDALVAPSLSSARNGGGSSSGSGTSAAGSSTNHRLPGDEELGFEAAVTALGLKANVSEADHPLLCEGTRRQRGELATLLLVHYKDDQERLAKIMDKLLDKEVHRMFKAPTLSSYYSTRPPPSDPRPRRADDAPAPGGGGGGDRDGDRPPASGSPPGWEEGYKLWEAKFRCTNLKTHRKHHSQGMASIDSSAPETTSSDNSPTLVRRAWAKPSGPGSDSGSSGKSSDSVGSSSSGGAGDRDAAAAAHPVRVPQESPPAAAPRPYPSLTPESLMNRHGVNNKAARFKNKRVYPSVPNQPSEAGAHFMFELAKSVLAKAGGNSSTSLFTQPSDAGAHRGPHRALHMCAFQIGLYALGLHNCVTPNWLSRTYSSNVSWVTGQAMELGAVAISCLVETWEGHLTPTEAAHIADCASRSRDGHVVRAAAGLTLSILPHAHALNQNEIQRALLQCKEQSTELLEKACLAVEGAAKGGGVYPEVLFDIATKWYQLYERTSPKQSASHDSGEDVPLLESPPPPPPPQQQQQQQQQQQVQQQAGPPQGVMEPTQQVHLSVAAAAPYPVTYSCLTAGPSGAQVGVNQLSVQMFVPYGPQPPAHPFPSAALQLYPAVSMQSMVAAAGGLPRTQPSGLPGGAPAVPMFSLPPQPHPHMVMLAQGPPPAAHNQPPPPPPIMVPVTLAAAAAAGALQHRPPPPPPPPPGGPPVTSQPPPAPSPPAASAYGAAAAAPAPTAAPPAAAAAAGSSPPPPTPAAAAPTGAGWCERESSARRWVVKMSKRGTRI